MKKDMPTNKIKFTDFINDIQTVIFELFQNEGYISTEKDKIDLINFFFTIKEYEINELQFPKIKKENLDKKRGGEYAIEKFSENNIQPVIFMNEALIDGMHRTFAKKNKNEKYIKGVELAEFINRKSKWIHFKSRMKNEIIRISTNK